MPTATSKVLRSLPPMYPHGAEAAGNSDPARTMLDSFDAETHWPMRIRGHDAIDDEVARVRTRLKQLEVERIELEAKLREWERPPAPRASRTGAVEGITATSSAADKVTLFRGLFAGRTDVFPVRWQNKKSGRSGYAPACANEWIRGVCNKPNIRCGECPNQAFIPVSDKIVERHLRGSADGGRFGERRLRRWCLPDASRRNMLVSGNRFRQGKLGRRRTGGDRDLCGERGPRRARALAIR